MPLELPINTVPTLWVTVPVFSHSTVPLVIKPEEIVVAPSVSNKLSPSIVPPKLLVVASRTTSSPFKIVMVPELVNTVVMSSTSSSPPLEAATIVPLLVKELSPSKMRRLSLPVWLISPWLRALPVCGAKPNSADPLSLRTAFDPRVKSTSGSVYADQTSRPFVVA